MDVNKGILTLSVETETKHHVRVHSVAEVEYGLWLMCYCLFHLTSLGEKMITFLNKTKQDKMYILLYSVREVFSLTVCCPCPSYM